jgi:hypothetical protein
MTCTAGLTYSGAINVAMSASSTTTIQSLSWHTTNTSNATGAQQFLTVWVTYTMP